MTATWTGRAWSCTVRLVVQDDSALEPASADLAAILAMVDATASRFRADSALSRANRHAGRPVAIPRLLTALVGSALEAAAVTGGAVDPTVGRALEMLGYDRDIAEVAADGGMRAGPTPFAAGWRAVVLDRRAGLLTVPPGSVLDLGATAKAWSADHAAHALAARYDTAVLVELGGDLAVAGHRPDGWCIRVAEREAHEGQLVSIRYGGVATSTTTVRVWRHGGAPMHHILDPATGMPATGPWRTVTVAAPCALAANSASTAAIILGDAAVDWLSARSLAARLVDRDGAVTVVGGWPADRVAVAA